MSAVPFVPVLLAGVVSILIQQIWYSPRVFGGAWLRLTNVSPEQVERDRKRQWLSALVGLLTGMLVALVMAYVGIAFRVESTGGAALLGFACWIGFCAPALLNQVLWDQKPLSLFWINALYWFLSFVLIAFILFYTATFQ